MANDLNLVVMTGRLGKDVELRYAPSGTAIANISIAVGGRKKNGDQWEDHVEWVRLVLLGRRAEVLAEYCKKGSHIRINGKFQTRSWDQDGQTKYMTEILVDDFQFLGSRPDSATNQPAQQQSQPAAQDGGFDSDIPF